MDKTAFELYLLKMWLDNGMKYIYKYKGRIRCFRREGLTMFDLFLDLDGHFEELRDIADYSDEYPEGNKVSVQELIDKREGRVTNDQVLGN